MRINRYLASAGLGSRRSVEDLIRAGKVQINGIQINDLGTRVQHGDQVFCDGAPVQPDTQEIYLALNKPEGYVVSHKVHPGQKSIYELVPEKFKKCNYIGRLDQDSCGLLLFSNNGDFIQRYSHPSHKLTRVYLVQVASTPLNLETLRKQFLAGFEDAGEFLQATSLELATRSSSLPGWPDQWQTGLRVGMQSGRKRQLRRMCAALNLEVLELERIAIGLLQLDEMDLARGALRLLTPEELKLLGWNSTPPESDPQIA